VEFRILGPVELWAAGRRIDGGSAKERCVLAILLWTPGHPVSVDSLVDRVWGDNPPRQARGSLYSYIARLRARLQRVDGDGTVHLVSGSGSYTLEADPESVDLHRFRRLHRQARAIGDSGDDEHAVLLLRDADRLWRGEPLAGLAGDWVSRSRANLADERLAATLDRVAAELRLGHHADLVSETADLVAEHPFVETLVEHLMVALYRCGRQAEALQAYRQLGQRLADELGTDPGPGLRELHQRILRGDAELAAKPGIGWASGAGPPDNLPRDIPNFTGRAAQMRSLLDAITTAPAETAVVIEAIDGMAGVGKSTLAIHAAHRLRARYPDARLYLNLHANDTNRGPLDPVAGLDTLLRLLGVSASRLPGTLAERAALWRAQLSHRRALVVLDDAASPDQVAPLLPGAAGCLVLITSRRRLTGLAGIRAVSLDVLSDQDAAALFTSIAGPMRAADARAVAEVTHRCGRLPLAIHLVASRLSHRPAWSVADLARRLSAADDQAGKIHAENPEIGASFALSCQGLTRGQQQMFRRMCLHPGPGFTVSAAAAAAAVSLADAELCVDVLLDHHLLEEPARGRFRFHDLIAAYGRDLAAQHDTEAERDLTLRRVLDYYLATADRADRILYPHRARLDPGSAPPAPPAMDAARLSRPQEAREWLDAELTNLLSAARQAAQHRHHEHAALLPHVLARDLDSQGHWETAITLHGWAIAAWRALGDPRGEACARSDLGFMLTRTGRYPDALRQEHQALAIFRGCADRRGEACVLDRIGLVHWYASRFNEALACHEQALVIAREIGDLGGQADALAHSALPLWHTGSYREAMRRLARALAIYRDIGDRQSETKTLTNIAEVQQHLGAYDDALTTFQQTLTVVQEAGDRQGEAVLLNNMGNVYQHVGRYAESLTHYRRAVTIYRDIGDRRCEADALNNIGAVFQRTEHFGEAVIHHQKALVVASELAEPYQQARALCYLGDAYLRSGRYKAALDDYHAALELSRQIGDPYQEGLALDGMGSALLHTEGGAAARERWRQALALFERLGVPAAAAVRARLSPPDSAAS
jgi:DNA-binding SARP family transcriptional activator